LSGRNSEVVYEIDYSDIPDEETPLQNGRILELQESDGKIYFILADEKTVGVYQIEDGEDKLIYSTEISNKINDASYDVKTGALVLVYRNSDVVLVDAERENLQKLPSEDWQIPWDVVARNGQVYYTEVSQSRIFGFSEKDVASNHVYMNAESQLYKIDLTPDGTQLLATDYLSYYKISHTGNDALFDEAEYVENAKVSYFYIVVLTWIALALGCVIVLFDLIWLLRMVFSMALEDGGVASVVFIVLASLSVAFLLSYSLVGQVMSEQEGASETQTRMFAEILLPQIDTEELLNIKSPSDYGGQSFQKIKRKLDILIQDSYARANYYYYLIYMKHDDEIDVIMEYEDRYTCWYPGYAYGDEPYTSVLEEGESAVASEISAYGAWTFAVIPIKDLNGNIIAALEVGRNLDQIQKDQRQMVVELVISTLISTVVIAMMLFEISFLLNVLGNKKKSKGFLDPTSQIPVRTLVFFSYLADSMQDAFIAVLLSDLYTDFLPISKGVAVALPMSLQLLAMALFSIIGGKLAERRGVRSGLMTGFLVELVGCAICVITGSYIGILIGKVLIGSGEGTVYVSCNTVASMGGDEAHTEKAFAGISAGVLSGITIGAGLSAVLLPIGGWRLIYIYGVVVLGLGFFIVSMSVSKNLESAKIAEKEESTGNVSVLWFMSRKRIIGFFLFLLIPFMMGLSYREYLFPLFATEQGMSEVSIGRVYLLCGLMVLYVGPMLSGWLLHNYGAKICVLLASGLLIADMVLFVIWPSMQVVIAGVIILSFITSFAYTCQYSYFDTLGEIHKYGSSAALGIYSMIESVGQTLGPIVYGALLALGYRKGIVIFASAMVSAMVLFLILSAGKQGTIKRKQDESISE